MSLIIGIIVNAAYTIGTSGTIPTAIVERISDFQANKDNAAATARIISRGFASFGTRLMKATGTIRTASVRRLAWRTAALRCPDSRGRLFSTESAIRSATGGIIAIMYTSSLLLMSEYGMSTARIQLI